MPTGGWVATMNNDFAVGGSVNAEKPPIAIRA